MTAVTREECRERTDGVVQEMKRITGKIEAVHNDTMHIKKELFAHQREHKVLKEAQVNGLNRRNSNIRLAAFIISAALAVGGIVWTVSKMSQPNVSEIAEAVVAAQNANPGS